MNHEIWKSWIYIRLSWAKSCSGNLFVEKSRWHWDARKCNFEINLPFWLPLLFYPSYLLISCFRQPYRCNVMLGIYLICFATDTSFYFLEFQEKSFIWLLSRMKQGISIYLVCNEKFFLILLCFHHYILTHFNPT